LYEFLPYIIALFQGEINKLLLKEKDVHHLKTEECGFRRIKWVNSAKVHHRISASCGVEVSSVVNFCKIHHGKDEKCGRKGSLVVNFTTDSP